MKKTMCIAAVITACFVIAIFAGSGDDTKGIQKGMRNPQPDESLTDDLNTISGVLLIVTSEEFWDPLQPLIDWKNDTGIPTYIVSWEELTYGGDCAEKIKYSIDYYYRVCGIRYVMLVGDSEKLPVRFTLRGYEEGIPFPEDMLNRHWDWTDSTGQHQVEDWDWCNGGQWYDGMTSFMPNFFASELYYADLYNDGREFQTWDTNGNGYFGEWYKNNLNAEGIDLMPDVAVGRVPASTVAEVQNYVEKVIAYESNAGNSYWFKKGLIVANDEFPYWTNAGKDLYNILKSCGFDAEYFEFDHTAPYSPIVQHIQDKLHEGLGFLLYIGHGPSGMGTPGHWVETGHMLPIVCHTGCHPGDFGPNLLTFEEEGGGYKATDGNWYDSYENGQHYACDQFPPIPEPLQPDELEGFYPESLLCRDPNHGAIAFYGATYPPQAPGYDLGKFLFEAYTRGYTLLGDMWIEAVKKYFNQHVASLTPNKNQEFRGINIWSWGPSDLYYNIQKFVLFGDPSLRVGGITTLAYSSESGYDETDGVDPDFGNTSTSFYYKVVYTGIDDEDPTYIRVYIDGTPHEMALDMSSEASLHDGDYANGEQYYYCTTLRTGSHWYYFAASDDIKALRLPSSSNTSGPIAYVRIVYVDGRHTGFKDGTIDFPYNTVSEGIEAIVPGAGGLIIIKSGKYNETITFDRKMDVQASDGTVTIGSE